MRRVAVLATGGTIATAPDAMGNTATTLSVADVVDTVGAVPDVEIVERDVLARSSRAMSPLNMLTLARAVEDASTGPEAADGVVVTHGTDTLEETAYLLSLVCSPDAPIVLTGAMRPPQEPGADGPANVRAAVSVAADPRVARYGPVVVFADEIHAARWVTKSHTVRAAGFCSPETGPVGVLAESRVHLSSPGVGSQRLGHPPDLERRVELLWTTAGSDGLLVDAAASAADGLVVAGTGGGHVPPPMAEALIRATSAGLPVVLGSRTSAGPVLCSTYSGTGSETHLLAHGVVPAGRLAPVKARLRLLVALGLGLGAEEVFPLE